jgi:hypothetical protein
MPVITPVPTKAATFLLGVTSYGFSAWNMNFSLETGDIRHFDADADGNSNYWGTVITNFASGEGDASGSVDDSGNLIPIGAGLYIGSTGTVTCLHKTGNGFSAPIVITSNDMGSNTADQDGAKRGIKFKLTGPPERVYSS